jgi:HD-like signal output (HDOD) protein/glycosyltransferase involved in cell wall biosynthesis
MKVIIQIPCFNEEASLPIVVSKLPRTLPGVDIVEWLVIDDGSRDRTREVARQLGVHHIVGTANNQGLARGFMLGIRSCLERGADVIVTMDADDQYNADDIPELIAPILKGEADFVVGERPAQAIKRFSLIKKLLLSIGSNIVATISGTRIKDSSSGLRAFSRAAASRLNVFSNYTYTLETILQAGQKNMGIASVPIRVNYVLRPSRLVRSVPSHVLRSIATMLRILVVYRPFRFFASVATLLFVSGFAIGLRFLYFYATGDGGGKVQSLLLSTTLLVLSFQTALLAFVADLQSVNRRLLEELLERQRARRPEAPRHQEASSAPPEASESTDAPAMHPEPTAPSEGAAAALEDALAPSAVSTPPINGLSADAPPPALSSPVPKLDAERADAPAPPPPTTTSTRPAVADAPAGVQARSRSTSVRSADTAAKGAISAKLGVDVYTMIRDRAAKGRVKVPPFPGVVLKLNEVIGKDKFTIDDLAQVLSVDQKLTADVLRCANSAAYGGSEKLTSLPKAVVRLGTRELVRICTGASLGALVVDTGSLVGLKRKVWIESVLGGLICQALATTRNLSADTGFLCGLLHDFGKSVALACVEDILKEHKDMKAMDASFWLGAVDRHHVSLGLFVAERWNLPPPLPAVIKTHHTVPEAPADARLWVDIVALSDRLVHFLSTRAFMAASDIGKLEGVASLQEAEAIMKAMRQLPPIVASMSGTSAQPAPSESKVEPPSTTLENPVDVNIPAQVLSASGGSPVEVIAVTPTGLAFKSPTVVHDASIIQMELTTARGLFRLWMQVELCRKDGKKEHTIEGKLFALGTELEEQWQEIVGDFS